jgi:hypothetical protein
MLADRTMGASALADAQAGALALAVETLIVEAPDPGQFEAALADAAKQGVDGLATMASPFLNFHAS